MSAGFGFGSPGTASGIGGFTFGSSSSNAGSTSGSIFGGIGATPSTPATPAATTSSASQGLGGGLFGQKSTGGFTFGGTSIGSLAPTTSSTFSLSFNKPAASATLFTLPIASSSTGGLPVSSTLSSVSTTTGLWQGSAGLTLAAGAASATSSNEGLGGIDFSSSADKKNKNLGTTSEDSKALRDEHLPPLICQDVDSFQKFVKEQKQVQEEISRMSSKSMLKVQEDIKSLKQLLSVAASGLQRNAFAIDKLKMETAQELKNAEIALRTQKTPPGLQHENTAPSDYFRVLVEQFEVQLQQYRHQIEELENHIAIQASSSHIAPQDLSLAMQKLYQTFVALAAQLQSIHENVKMLKEQYLGYRKAFLGDTADVFEARRAESKKWQSAPRITTGPTPFNSIPNAAAVAMAATLTQQQQSSTGPQSSLGSSFTTAFGSGIGAGLQSSGLGSSSLGGFGTTSATGINFSDPGLTASAGLTFGISNPASTAFGTGGPLLQLKKPG